MIDLFGLEQQPKRIHDTPEAAALVEVLKALNTHSAVACRERMNSGAAMVGNRFISFGWPGCPDVLGQLHDGRMLGVEVKAPTGKLRPEQAVFLERIRGACGATFTARDCRDVPRVLGPMPVSAVFALLPPSDFTCQWRWPGWWFISAFKAHSTRGFLRFWKMSWSRPLTTGPRNGFFRPHRSPAHALRPYLLNGQRPAELIVIVEPSE